MASYGVAITLPLPQSGQVQWDGPLNDLLQQLIDVLAQRVTVDGLSVGAALDMQGNALIDATSIEFVTDGDPGVANSIYYSAGGELFVRDGQNRAIQLTSGGVVNVAGSGGFGGDYVSSNQNGASFTNATSTFTFTVSGGTSYATMENGDVKIHNGSSANSVGLKSPSGLGSSYSLTLPTALPTTGLRVVQVDSTGSWVFMPASASVTSSIDVSCGIVGAVGGGTPTYDANGWTIANAGASVHWPIPLEDGETLDGVSFSTTSSVSYPEVTASLVYRGSGFKSQVARCAFNPGLPILGFKTLSGSTPTLTGTMPFTHPGTGSLYLELAISNTSVAFKVDAIRKTSRVPRK